VSATSSEILAAIRALGRGAWTVRELLRLLDVPRTERRTFVRTLDDLVVAGELLVARGHRYAVPSTPEQIVGRFAANSAGYGFVTPETSTEPPGSDVFIAAANTHGAMHGDTVAVVVERTSSRGAEGRVLEVLERRHRTLVGRFEIDSVGLGSVVPFDPRLVAAIRISSGDASSAEPGEMVLAEITRWPTPSRGATGRVVEVLGHVEEPGVDTRVIMHSFGIPDRHPAAAVAEALACGAEVRAADIERRTDFRSQVTVTIDGEDARDFDDAITIARRGDGLYELGVHIADVAHYVSEGTALDEEAYDRGTSVYFTERAVHMIPAELATGLCSLNPQVDRLVQSCVMKIDAAGLVVGYTLHDGVIHSTARMTYTQVNAILVERDQETIDAFAPLVPTFTLMHELFEILLARRRRRGAIDFDLPEAKVLLGEAGNIEAIVAAERNVAHRIIEEFMLLANETVAGHLVDHAVPALHRVHEAPDAAKVDAFEGFLAPLGHGLGASGPALRPRHFQALVDRIQGAPEARAIAVVMLRTMQKARYDAASLGHFGLAAERYTHFTSPIRRYPDLVVHRMLRESRRHPIGEDRRRELEETLPDAASHLSAMERRADDAERELLQWKKARFMTGKVGNEYAGVIVGVAPFGLFVELDEYFIEGLVHVSSMADDYYRFLDQQQLLFGEGTKKTYRLGDRVEVQVLRVDMTRRQVEMGVVEILNRVRKHPDAVSTRRVSAPRRADRAQRPGRRERAARSKKKGGRW
jgi:ribonuclease R